ncbi:MAG: leucine-rich repeat domain-containing protein [Bacteroidetes bacterium]|nr:leucine-rich repeat domain-containing protein [Bacteroidota bacterium]
MFKSKHYQGNGTLAKNTDTSSYADACSKITTSNVVETTTRGGILTTSRVVVLLLFVLTFSAKAQIPTVTILDINAGGTINSDEVDAALTSAGLLTTDDFHAIIPKGEGIRTIGLSAFAGKNVISIIGEDIENSINMSFQGCSKLEKVVLPKCRVLGTLAFENCNALRELTLGKQVPTYPNGTPMDEFVFYGITDLSLIKLNVPEKSVDLYAAHPVFGQMNIVGIPQKVTHINKVNVKKGRLIITPQP